jgi:hypothetical protein
MRLKSFVNELASIYGPGITFLDIDETILHTHARVQIKKNGKIIKRLRNHEYLDYKKAPDEEVDFAEYTDADLFYKTSDPIKPVIDRIRKMFVNITKRGSKVVIISGREDLNNKQKFLDTFRKFDFPIDNIYVERLGNIPGATTDLPSSKRNVALKYLSTGLYRRARMIDDSRLNCLGFLELEKTIPQEVLDKVRERYKIPENDTLPPIQFFALQVQKDGSLKRITRSE